MSIQPQQAAPTPQSALAGLSVSEQFASLFAEVPPVHPALPDENSDAAVRRIHSRLYVAALDSWTDEPEWRTHAADEALSSVLLDAIPREPSDEDLALVRILVSSIGGIRQGDVDALAATTWHASCLITAWTTRAI